MIGLLKSHCLFANQVEAKFKRHVQEFAESIGAEGKVLSAALQTILARFRLVSYTARPL